MVFNKEKTLHQNDISLRGVKKILVIGCSGAGKTVLSQKLHALTELPIVHLDKLYWRAGWEMTDKSQWQGTLREVLQRDAWIMDGNYMSSLEMRVALADLVIWLDYPTSTCFYRVLLRTLSMYGKNRPDVAEGCPERFDLDFLRYVATFRRKFRPRLLQIKEGFPHKKWLLCRNTQETEAFLQKCTLV